MSIAAEIEALERQVRAQDEEDRRREEAKSRLELLRQQQADEAERVRWDAAVERLAAMAQSAVEQRENYWAAERVAGETIREQAEKVVDEQVALGAIRQAWGNAVRELIPDVNRSAYKYLPEVDAKLNRLWSALNGRVDLTAVRVGQAVGSPLEMSGGPVAPAPPMADALRVALQAAEYRRVMGNS